MTKNLTQEGREMTDNLTALLPTQKNLLDITTRAGVERVEIDPCFTGQVILHFSDGGFAGADKRITMKIK